MEVAIQYEKNNNICCESGDVRGETVTSWKERLPEILEGYTKEDIYNLDETGCFWRALSTCGFGVKGKECKGGKVNIGLLLPS